MATIDGRVQNLNPQVLKTLEQFKSKSELNEADIQKLTDSMLADGQIDDSEKDLVKELLSSKVQISISGKPQAGFEPAAPFQMSAKASQGAAAAKLQQLSQISDAMAQNTYSFDNQSAKKLKQLAAGGSETAFEALGKGLEKSSGASESKAYLDALKELAAKPATRSQALAAMAHGLASFGAESELVAFFKEKLAAGDPEAQSILRQIALDPRQDSYLRTQAASMLTLAKNLGPEDYAALVPAISTSRHVIHDAEAKAKEILKAALKANKPGIIEGLKQAAGPGQDSWAARAASELLMQVKDKLKPEDYPLLIPALDSTSQGDAAAALLEKSLKAGNPALQEALKEALRKPDSMTAPKIALVLAAAPKLSGDDVALLVPGLGAIGGSKEKVQALLEREAKAGNQAVLDALRQASKGGMGRETASGILARSGKMDATDYPLLLQNLGPYAEGGKQAREQLVKAVKAGDQGVLAALRKEAKEGFHKKEAATILAQAGDQLKSEDYPLLTPALDDAKVQEMLGKAAKAGDAQALTALRAVLKANDRYDSNPEAAARLLATSGQLQAEDYPLLLKQADQAPVAKALVDAAKADKPGALDAIRSGLTPPTARAVSLLSQIPAFTPTAAERQALIAWMKASPEAAVGVPALLIKQLGGEGDAEIRQALRSAVKSNEVELAQATAKAMTGAAAKLKPADIDALVERVLSYEKSPYAADRKAGEIVPEVLKTLAAAAPHLSPETRSKAISALRAQIGQRESLGLRHHALQGMQAMLPYLSKDDVDAVAKTASGPIVSRQGEQPWWHDDAFKLLTEAAEKHPDAAIRKQASVEALRLGKSSLGQDPKLLRILAQNATQQQDPELQAQIAAALPPSPVTAQDMEGVAKAYQDEIGRAIQNARPGTKMEEYRKCLQLLHLAKDSKYASKIDPTKLNAKIQALAAHPDIKAEFEACRGRAISRQFGYSSHPAQQVKDYILSENFYQKLRMLPAEAQAEAIKQEVQKLAFLDPGSVKDVTSRLGGKLILASGQEAYNQLPPEKTQDVLTDLIAETSDELADAETIGEGRAVKEEKGVKKGTKAARDAAKKVSYVLDRALRELSLTGKVEPEQLKAHLIAKYGKTGGAAAAWFSKMEKSGKLGALDALFATVNLATTGVPSNLKDAASSTSSLFSAISKTEDIAKILGASKDTLTAWSKTFKALKYLGPVGDTISAVVDGYGSYKDFKDGDYVGAAAKGVGAVAGASGAVAGVLILAGSTGPGAPIVVAVAAGVGLIAWGVDAIWGESDEETLIRQMGVKKDD